MPKKARKQRKGKGGQKGGGARGKPTAKARASAEDRQSRNQEVDTRDVGGAEVASTATGLRKESPKGGGASGAKVAGLSNLGNTCFLNSALQVLKACPSLQRYYATCGDATRDKPLTCVLGEWFRFAGDGKKGGGTYKPANLVQEIRRLAPQFKGHQQHDSHELLRYVLDMLQNEGKGSVTDEKGQTENEDDLAHQGNLVGGIFGGTFASSISCTHCGHISEQNEEFLDLSVPVVQIHSTGSGVKGASEEEKENIRSRGWMTAKERQRLKKELHRKVSMEQKAKEECMKASLQNDSSRSNATNPPLQGGEPLGNNDSPVECKPSSTEPAAQAGNGDLSVDMAASATAVEPGINSSASVATVSSSEWGSKASSKAATVERCLAKFFEEEQVYWECPREADERQKRTSSKHVRFSESKPAVFEVPASDGCRGSDILNGMTFHEMMSRKAHDDDSDEDSSEGVGDEQEEGGKEATDDGAKDEEELAEDGDVVVMEEANGGLKCVKECIQYGSQDEVEGMVAGEEGRSEEHEVWEESARDGGEGAETIGEECESVGSVEICSSSEEDAPQSEGSGCCSSERTYSWSKVWTSSLRSCLKKRVEMKEAHKKYSIQAAPRVLTIHLKRFDRNQYGKLVKVKTHVEFGMEIEMGPFCEPSGRSIRYQLFGVIEHRGGMRGGHYVAYVKRSFPEDDDGGDLDKRHGRWFFVSDQVVREVAESEVAAREAYLLLYERV